ncbi:hypothetical protein DFS34DRAFT_685640 [Phlyctochytrium arcticum]|nr:hypothetical protein DFS34DRAFT_685640 [Phlyctochytrium arcticum]
MSKASNPSHNKRNVEKGKLPPILQDEFLELEAAAVQDPAPTHGGGSSNPRLMPYEGRTSPQIWSELRDLRAPGQFQESALPEIAITYLQDKEDEATNELQAKRQELFHITKDLEGLYEEIEVDKRHEEKWNLTVQQLITESIQLIQGLSLVNVIQPSFNERLLEIAERHSPETGISTQKSLQAALVQAQEQQRMRLREGGIGTPGHRPQFRRPPGGASRLTSVLQMNEGHGRSRMGSVRGSLESLVSGSTRGSNELLSVRGPSLRK